MKKKKIQVTKCHAFGESFNNLKPGSVHEVIPAPQGYKNDKRDCVWVMGVGEPVLLLRGEYKVLP